MGRDRRGEGQCFAWCVTHGERGWGGREKQLMNPADPEEKRGVRGGQVCSVPHDFLRFLTSKLASAYFTYSPASLPEPPSDRLDDFSVGVDFIAEGLTRTHPMRVDVHSHCKAKESRARGAHGARIYWRAGRKSFVCAHPNACSLDMGIRVLSSKVTKSVSVLQEKLYGHQSPSSGLGILILSI